MIKVTYGRLRIIDFCLNGYRVWFCGNVGSEIRSFIVSMNFNKELNEIQFRYRSAVSGLDKCVVVTSKKHGKLNPCFV